MRNYKFIWCLFFCFIFFESSAQFYINKSFDFWKYDIGVNVLDYKDNCLVMAASDTDSYGRITRFILMEDNGDVQDDLFFRYYMRSEYYGWIGSTKMMGDKIYYAGSEHDTSGKNIGTIFKGRAFSLDTFMYRITNKGVLLYDLDIVTKNRIIVSGLVSTDSNFWNIAYYFAMLDTVGNILWERQYFNDSTSNYGISVTYTFDGKFIASGMKLLSYKTNNYNWDYYDEAMQLMVLDTNGNMLIDTILNSPYQDAAGTLITTNTGEVVGTFGYALNDERPGEVRPKLFSFGTDGKMRWIKDIRQDVWDNYFWGLIKTRNGDIIAAGSTYPNGISYNEQGWMCRFDKEGNKLWDRKYTIPDGINHYFYDVCEMPNGDLAATGWVSYDDARNQDIWFVRTDSFGCLEPNCQYNDGMPVLANNIEVITMPNPFKNTITLRIWCNNLTDPIDLTLYNVNGKKVFTQSAMPTAFTSIQDNTTKGYAEINIDTRAFAAGMYVYRVAQKKESVSGKIIKQ